MKLKNRITGEIVPANVAIDRFYKSHGFLEDYSTEWKIPDIISRSEARAIIVDFCKKYAGKSVLFHRLNAEDKFGYVLVHTFNYFDFLPGGKRLDRAIENATVHKNNGYKDFGADDPNKHMIIGK